VRDTGVPLGQVLHLTGGSNSSSSICKKMEQL
jgi:hypothetical protein